MQDLVWVTLVVGSGIMILALVVYRKMNFIAILKLLKKRHDHIYTKYFPPNAEPDFLLTVKKGFVPFQLLRNPELKDDKEITGLLWTNVSIVLVQILLIMPVILFVLELLNS